jgi:hypothetical protein
MIAPMILEAGAMALVLGAAAGGTSTELAQLFADWRRFEQPPLREGVPDYTATTFAAGRSNSRSTASCCARK